jgi:alpha-beta hydrolase superfamily lysophospholipase
MNVTRNDFTTFDRPEILDVLFHPRADHYLTVDMDCAVDIFFEMEDGVKIGAKLHTAGKDDPVILFFHGNGEIVSDYDDLGPIFSRMGINFLPVDYRGYGRSTGRPTVTSMMSDCHVILKESRKYLINNGHTGKLIVMGRSLGSASALEIAFEHQDQIDGLIIESGFAFMMPLLELLGLKSLNPGISEEDGPRNYEKIKKFQKPTLVIHAQYDHIIPFTDGETLYRNSQANDKTLLEIKGADHNNIFMLGFEDYMNAVKTLAVKIG